MNPKTIVYIDGFNLFYGALKRTPYKWLNIKRLCDLLLPQNDVTQIKYFTARVIPRPNKPDQHINQNIYLRALATLPNVETIFGHYLTNIVRMRVANPAPGQPKTVEVIKTEEKGSDVNIASHLLNDAHNTRFDVAVIISNDSDLLTPIEIVQKELDLPVGIICPFPQFARVLARGASFKKKIRRGVLAASQFPPTLQDANGTFRKPKSW